MRASIGLFITICLTAVACCWGQSNSDATNFASQLAISEQLASLTSSDARPFHLKLKAEEKNFHDPRYQAEIEIWWVTPIRWRRVVRSVEFSQTAVQDGQRYQESNEGEYLPWWLHEVIQETLDPLPLEELKNERNVELTSGDCGRWQTQYGKGSDKIEVSNSVCFNADGTPREIFSRTAGVTLADYRFFGDKKIPRRLTIWPGGRFEVEAVIATLEELPEDKSLFPVTGDSGFQERVRFVSVPESSLAVDPASHGEPVWPVVHNFPNTGAITVSLKIDRNGNVQEVGGAVSHNVVMSEAAEAQVKKWKFKPYLVDGSPVQVNTNVTMRFDAKVELLGATSGNSIPMQPFVAWIEEARKLSDPRTENSPPFHLRGTFNTSDNSGGTFEEQWISPTRWRRKTAIGTVSLSESRDDDRLFHKLEGTKFTPRPIDTFLDALNGFFPDLDTLQEGDWGQSAVQLGRVDMVRVARGAVNAQNEPIDGQAYWFDSAGLLRAAYVHPTTATYAGFAAWNDKQIPHRMEVSRNGVRILSVSIEQIEAQEPLPASSFTLPGVKPEVAGDSAEEYRGPVLVQPQPLLRVAPEKTSVHGTVIVAVHLDAHGHVGERRGETERRSRGG